MYQRLVTHSGNPLLNTIRCKNIKRVIRADVTKGSGIPAARFSVKFDADFMYIELSGQQTMNLSGLYKFTVLVEADGKVQTVRYGHLEVR